MFGQGFEFFTIHRFAAAEKATSSETETETVSFADYNQFSHTTNTPQLLKLLSLATKPQHTEEKAEKQCHDFYIQSMRPQVTYSVKTSLVSGKPSLVVFAILKDCNSEYAYSCDEDSVPISIVPLVVDLVSHKEEPVSDWTEIAEQEYQ